MRCEPKRRYSLLVGDSIVVSVYLCRYTKWPNGRPCWFFYPVAGDTQNITLLCTMNSSNDDVQDFYVFPSLGRTGTYRFGSGSKWLRKTKRLGSISEFHAAIEEIAGSPNAAPRQRAN